MYAFVFDRSVSAFVAEGSAELNNQCDLKMQANVVTFYLAYFLDIPI
jgi:hypothetical protein